MNFKELPLARTEGHENTPVVRQLAIGTPPLECLKMLRTTDM